MITPPPRFSHFLFCRAQRAAGAPPRRPAQCGEAPAKGLGSETMATQCLLLLERASGLLLLSRSGAFCCYAGLCCWVGLARSGAAIWSCHRSAGLASVSDFRILPPRPFEPWSSHTPSNRCFAITSPSHRSKEPEGRFLPLPLLAAPPDHIHRYHLMQS